jgi:hypothetical protein
MIPKLCQADAGDGMLQLQAAVQVVDTFSPSSQMVPP